MTSANRGAESRSFGYDWGNAVRGGVGRKASARGSGEKYGPASSTAFNLAPSWFLVDSLLLAMDMIFICNFGWAGRSYLEELFRPLG